MTGHTAPPHPSALHAAAGTATPGELRARPVLPAVDGSAASLAASPVAIPAGADPSDGGEGDVADAHRADLIAVGSRRHGWLDRALLGSVTTERARDGRHALLAVPPRAPSPPRRLDV